MGITDVKELHLNGVQKIDTYGRFKNVPEATANDEPVNFEQLQTVLATLMLLAGDVQTVTGPKIFTQNTGFGDVETAEAKAHIKSDAFDQLIIERTGTSAGKIVLGIGTYANSFLVQDLANNRSLFHFLTNYALCRSLLPFENKGYSLGSLTRVFNNIWGQRFLSELCEVTTTVGSAVGKYAKADVYSQTAISSGRDTVTGDRQGSFLEIHGVGLTDGTPFNLYPDNDSAKKITLTNGICYSAIVNVTFHGDAQGDPLDIWIRTYRVSVGQNGTYGNVKVQELGTGEYMGSSGTLAALTAVYDVNTCELTLTASVSNGSSGAEANVTAFLMNTHMII